MFSIGFFNPCSLCPEGSADPDQVRAQTQTLTSAFFSRHLKGDASADEVLVGARLPSGIDLQTRIAP